MTHRPVPPDPRRSAMMAGVRQKGTSAELTVAGILRSLGHAYRLNVRSLPGSPDFANRRRKWAVFVQGCFWHHHTNCRRATVPKSNAEFWRTKFTANRARDARAIRVLRSMGFRVVTVWECEVAKPDVLAQRLSEILEPRRVDMGEPIDHRGVMVDVAGLRRWR
jgi:DNA mismatch endonuclease (patch repair protein)